MSSVSSSSSSRPLQNSLLHCAEACVSAHITLVVRAVLAWPTNRICGRTRSEEIAIALASNFHLCVCVCVSKGSWSEMYGTTIMRTVGNLGKAHYIHKVSQFCSAKSPVLRSKYAVLMIIVRAQNKNKYAEIATSQQPEHTHCCVHGLTCSIAHICAAVLYDVPFAQS